MAFFLYGSGMNENDYFLGEWDWQKAGNCMAKMKLSLAADCSVKQCEAGAWGQCSDGSDESCSDKT